MRPLLAGLLAAILLAVSGCLAGVPSGQDGSADAHDGSPLMAGPALWPDPQNAPHPAFGWPTLSNPPVGPDVSDWWQPFQARPLPEDPSGLREAAHVEGIPSGAGIAVFGRLAVVPESGSAAHLVDLTDPLQPRVLSSFETGGRGAAIIAYPDGRLVTVLAASGTIDVVDITDPTAPELLGPIEVSSHKLGVVPGTPIVYNAGNGGGGAPSQLGEQFATGSTAIFDLTDPENPVHVQDFANGYGCHHIFFWISVEQDRSRAICAGFQAVQLWDIADPRDPTVVVTIPFPHGMVGLPSGRLSVYSFAHTAGLNLAGDVLYVGDESNGGAPPGCAAEVRSEDGTSRSVPMGATWFYDLSDEADPQFRGWFSPANDPRVNNPDPTGDPTEAVRSCTTHHGRLVPDPDRDLVAMGFYGAGVILIDFTDPATPKALDQWTDGTTDVWEVWYAGGYLFTGDLVRGMDVLEVV